MFGDRSHSEPITGSECRPRRGDKRRGQRSRLIGRGGTGHRYDSQLPRGR